MSIDLTTGPRPGELAFEWPAGFVPTYVDDTLPHQIRLVARPAQYDGPYSQSHSCTGTGLAVFVTCSCGDLESSVTDPDSDVALAIWRAHVADEVLS